MTKSKEVATVNAEVLAQLEESYPSEPAAKKIILPRLGMFSQDQTEGKGKAMKVTAEAGTFYTEAQNEAGDWEKNEIGDEVEVIIMYNRKQLSYYDEDTEQYTSSPVYDSADEIIPLWRDKKEVDRGTPAELQARKEYDGQTAKGKYKSNLAENRILYVLMDGEPYQLNLRGSSMYSYLTYARTVLPPAMMTTLNSEAKEKGSICWNQMTFNGTPLDGKAITDVVARVAEIKETIAAEKAQYAAPKTEAEADVIDGNEDLKDF